MSGQDTQLRREKASAKAVKAQKYRDQVNYEIVGDDILILNGPYRDCRVKELFQRGAVERDYIVRHIWFTGEPEVIKIINSLVCK